MRRLKLIRLVAAGLLALAPGGAVGAPLTLPFDFGRGAIGLAGRIQGADVFIMLDTGADPSVVDLALARRLGLKVDIGGGGEASGEGDAKSAPAYPAVISGLMLGGRAFAAVPALAADLSPISAGYDRRVDAVLGYSFLDHRILLIDYARRSVGILDDPAQARPSIQGCRTRYVLPLRTAADMNGFPVIAAFRFGAAVGPVTLDTGSNGLAALDQSALALPAVKGALQEAGAIAHTGARGAALAKAYRFQAPMGFGPFTLPAGQLVSVRPEQGSMQSRIANVGNPAFAAMKLKMLLDYRSRRMTFFGDCPAAGA